MGETFHPLFQLVLRDVGLVPQRGRHDAAQMGLVRLRRRFEFDDEVRHTIVVGHGVRLFVFCSYSVVTAEQRDTELGLCSVI